MNMNGKLEKIFLMVLAFIMMYEFLPVGAFATDNRTAEQTPTAPTYNVSLTVEGADFGTATLSHEGQAEEGTVVTLTVKAFENGLIEDISITGIAETDSEIFENIEGTVCFTVLSENINIIVTFCENPEGGIMQFAAGTEASDDPYVYEALDGNVTDGKLYDFFVNECKWSTISSYSAKGFKYGDSEIHAESSSDSDAAIFEHNIPFEVKKAAEITSVLPRPKYGYVQCGYAKILVYYTVSAVLAADSPTTEAPVVENNGKVYKDETVTVKAKNVDGYTATISGLGTATLVSVETAEDYTAFTVKPTETNIYKVKYEEATNVKLNIAGGEFGSVTGLAVGDTAYLENTAVSFTATPTDNGYISSIVVEGAEETISGYNPSRGKTGSFTVGTSDVTVTVTFAEKSMSANATANVKFDTNKTVSEQLDKLKQNIFAAVVNNTAPAGLEWNTDGVTYTFKSVPISDLGQEYHRWKELDAAEEKTAVSGYEISYPAFPTTLNSDAVVKITWAGNEQYPEVYAESTITLIEGRDKATISYTEPDEVEFETEAQIEAAVLEAAFTNSSNAITATRLTSALPTAGETATLTYKLSVAEDTDYLANEIEVTVEVKAKSNPATEIVVDDTVPQVIKYRTIGELNAELAKYVFVYEGNEKTQEVPVLTTIEQTTTENTDVKISVKAVYAANETYPGCEKTFEANVRYLTPVVSGTGIASGTYGDTLAQLSVSGLTVTFDGQEVAGTWALNGNAVPSAGETETAAATFTPADSAIFAAGTVVTATVPLQVAPKSISAADVILPENEFAFNGQEHQPAVTVKLDGKTLTPDTDYTVEYSDNVNASATATVTVKGTGNYSGTATGSFEIKQAQLTIKAYDLVLGVGDKAPENSYVITSGQLYNGDAIDSIRNNINTENVFTGTYIHSNAIIKNGETDVTGNYDITYTEGVLGVVNSWESVEYTANGYFGKLERVLVNGEEITMGDDYTAAEGSTVITLKADYLKTLKTGKHTLTVQYTDGEASCEFTVKAGKAESAPRALSDVPSTSDNTNVSGYMILMVLSAMTVLILNRKKR